ncbi:uncharacterized protein LOC107813666 [Nicotiana tabacum]|uniref:Uncharacterized protein LOC107813666 n=2 Tax=Nicotiana TaxID=4085 RepID=A0A1S4BZW1_TOBAC|nr:PREDICTED: uncharacterized protein LOC104232434 [Nicotiana sylvestris]XP_016494436.1 PREDICTED: uncharacterized protein LOC107813666 [Nicotiana tabacum]
MALKLHHCHLQHLSKFTSASILLPNFQTLSISKLNGGITRVKSQKISSKIRKRRPISASVSPLDLTEDNIIQVLEDAKAELAQLFDNSVGITGKAELAEVDGPYVKLRLSGKFWHKRSTVVARLGNYLKQRIPEILEVDIEDEKQLDDSPANF